MKKAASGDHELVPIDHGYVLPDTFQDISFEWLYWPQARAPFGKHSEVGVCSRTWHVLLILRGFGWRRTYRTDLLLKRPARSCPCSSLRAVLIYIAAPGMQVGCLQHAFREPLLMLQMKPCAHT